MSNNYFNSLSLREQLAQLGQCRFMSSDEFSDGVNALKGRKILVIGCGAQGLNQGLNLRDSGLDVAYALREQAIREKNVSHGRMLRKMALLLVLTKSWFLTRIWY